MKNYIRLLLTLTLAWTAFGQAPVQRNPWSTNVTGNAVRGNNNLSVTNLGSLINWLFYGVQAETVARLTDITNHGTGLFVLKAGDTMTGSLATIGLTNTGGLTNNGPAFVSGKVSVGTNAGPARLNIDSGGASPLNSPLWIGTNGATLFAITNGLVGVGKVPISALDVTGVIASSSSVQANANLRAGAAYSIYWNGRAAMTSGAVGYIDLLDQYGGVDFYGLRFGGIASTNAMLYYTSAGRDTVDGTPNLEVKLGDGSDWTDFKAKRIILDDATSVVGNTRGVNAQDLQAGRNSATKVASGTSSFIGGGTNNTASGAQSAVVGGEGNVASQSYCFIGGGRNHTASLQGAVVLGGYEGSSTASGRNSLAVGSSCVASAYGSFASSYGAVAPLYGQMARSAFVLSVAGDAQASTLTFGRTITISGSADRTTIGAGLTNDWCDLRLGGDGVIYRATLPSTNSVWTFKILVSGKASTAGVDKVCGWECSGVIKKTGTTTSIVGAVTHTELATDDGDWEVRVVADDTYDCLSPQVFADEPTYWSAALTMSELKCP